MFFSLTVLPSCELVSYRSIIVPLKSVCCQELQILLLCVPIDTNNYARSRCKCYERQGVPGFIQCDKSGDHKLKATQNLQSKMGLWGMTFKAKEASSNSPSIRHQWYCGPLSVDQLPVAVS